MEISYPDNDTHYPCMPFLNCVNSGHVFANIRLQAIIPSSISVNFFFLPYCVLRTKALGFKVLRTQLYILWLSSLDSLNNVWHDSCIGSKRGLWCLSLLWRPVCGMMCKVQFSDKSQSFHTESRLCDWSSPTITSSLLQWLVGVFLLFKITLFFVNVTTSKWRNILMLIQQNKRQSITVTLHRVSTSRVHLSEETQWKLLIFASGKVNGVSRVYRKTKTMS